MIAHGGYCNRCAAVWPSRACGRFPWEPSRATRRKDTRRPGPTSPSGARSRSRAASRRARTVSDGRSGLRPEAIEHAQTHRRIRITDRPRSPGTTPVRDRAAPRPREGAGSTTSRNIDRFRQGPSLSEGLGISTIARMHLSGGSAEPARESRRGARPGAHAYAARAGPRGPGGGRRNGASGGATVRPRRSVLPPPAPLHTPCRLVMPGCAPVARNFDAASGSRPRRRLRRSVRRGASGRSGVPKMGIPPTPGRTVRRVRSPRRPRGRPSAPPAASQRSTSITFTPFGGSKRKVPGAGSVFRFTSWNATTETLPSRSTIRVRRTSPVLGSTSRKIFS